MQQNVIRPVNPLPPVQGSVNVEWVAQGHARAFFAGREVRLPDALPRDKAQGPAAKRAEKRNG